MNGAPVTDALDLAAQVRAGEVSARELTEAAIGRIEATNPELNYLVTDCFERVDGSIREDRHALETLRRREPKRREPRRTDGCRDR